MVVGHGPGVSIPYWLGSKLRDPGSPSMSDGTCTFQSPIGWGLSCEAHQAESVLPQMRLVSIPYWLGSKLRELKVCKDEKLDLKFQSPIGWGLSCETVQHYAPSALLNRFNPLLVGV